MVEIRVIGLEDRPKRPIYRRSRLAIVMGSVLLGLGAAFLVATAVLLQRASPILRARVINTLSTRFDSRVELQEFDISGWDGLEVTGKGLKLYPHSLDRPQSRDQSRDQAGTRPGTSSATQPSDQPALMVGEFQFRVHWWNLLRSPMHIGEVHLSDLTIYRPSGSQRAQMKQEADSRGQNGKQPKIEIYVEQLQIDRARLILGTNNTADQPGMPAKVPLTFNIQSLELHDIGAGQPLSFHATLVNPKPLGDIDTSGYFGPFNEHEPGSSPVRGDYNFTHADLSTIKGIGGMLSSTGRYAGKLEQIVIDGETDTPNFSLDVSSSRPVPLHTKFHATVDGMNGNTYLQPVDAMMARSHIVATGSVTRAPEPGRPGAFGHLIQLQVHVGPADIADMLRMAVKTSPPMMHGALHLVTSFDLPPGRASVAQRMRLKGQFQMANVLFTNYKVQNDVNQLSLRGQGQAQQADDAAHNLVKPIPSAMRGSFTLQSANLTLTGLHCDVPGADIAVDGLYSLDGKQLNIHGKARLQAKVSQMVTGWRSLLLTPADRYLSRNGAGVEVPFELSGTEAEPKFGVDLFGHHFGNDNRDKQKNQNNPNNQTNPKE